MFLTTVKCTKCFHFNPNNGICKVYNLNSLKPRYIEWLCGTNARKFQPSPKDISDSIPQTVICLPEKINNLRNST